MTKDTVPKSSLQELEAELKARLADLEKRKEERAQQRFVSGPATFQTRYLQ